MNTTSPTSRYAKFLDQFWFGTELRNGQPSSKVRWTGKVGYVDLGALSNALARIELNDRGSQGTYTGFHVEIIHRANGRIDSMTFEFNDILDPKERTDGREKDSSSFHGWTSSSDKKPLEWYIAKPTKDNVLRFVRAVNEYLEMWQVGPR